MKSLNVAFCNCGLLHEQNDPKFGAQIDKDNYMIMTQDHVPCDEQEVVLDLITKCSFKKRQLIDFNDQC